MSAEISTTEKPRSLLRALRWPALCALLLVAGTVAFAQRVVAPRLRPDPQPAVKWKIAWVELHDFKKQPAAKP